VFAVVDTGVSKPVSLVVSSDVTNVQNPEAIAIATASQLLAQGIPNVLIGKVVYDGFLTGTAGLPITIPVDLSGYASVQVFITGIVNTCLLSYQWLDAVTLQPYANRNLVISSGGARITFASPVRSPTLAFILSSINGVNPPHVRIYASNRIVADDKVFTDPSGEGVSISSAVAWISGNAYTLSGNYLSPGGLHYARFSAQAGFKCFWGYNTVDGNNVMTTRYIADTGGCHTSANGNLDTEIVLAIPAGVLTLAILAMASGAFGITVDLQPADN
jgi:hypothetical protein